MRTRPHNRGIRFFCPGWGNDQPCQSGRADSYANDSGSRTPGWSQISPKLVSLAEVAAPTNSAAEQPARKVVQRREPEYPPLAAAMSLHGTVKLKVQIAPNGSVRRVGCTGGHPLLAQAAITAVQGWEFEPAAKETTQVVNIDF